MMGGSDKILAKGKVLIENGKYLEATEILNKLVYAEPKNQNARNMLADAFEQIGYQQESTSVRNSFLQAAYELRSGLPGGEAVSSSGPDIIRAMPTGHWLDFIGISMDSRKAEGMTFTINLVTPDNNEKFLIEMSNATLTNIRGYQAKKPDLTITLNRSDLNSIMMGISTFEELAASGKAKLQGDLNVLEQLKSTLVQFSPNFEIMPGTLNAQPTPATTKPFQFVVQPALTFAE